MTVEYQKVWRTMNDLELVTSKICSAREIIDNAIDKIQLNENDKAELLMNAAYEFLEYYLQEFDDKFKLAWQATVGDLRDGDKEAYDAAMKERDYYDNVMPSATQRDTNKYCKAYDFDNQVCLDDTIGKLQNTILWPPEKEKSDKPNLSFDKNDISTAYKGSWNDFWESYYPEEPQQYTEEELNAMCDKAELDAQLEQIRKDGGYEWTPEVAKKKWVLPVEEAKDMDTDETEYFVSFPQDLLDAADLKEGDAIHWIDNKDGSYTIRKSTKPVGPDEC